MSRILRCETSKESFVCYPDRVTLIFVPDFAIFFSFVLRSRIVCCCVSCFIALPAPSNGTHEMDSITHKIAEYSATSKFADLTEESVHAATQRLVDSLGCALGAHDCEPAQIGRRLAASQVPGKYPGRVLCFADRLPAEAAAFINSAMICNLDFNDRYPGGHPSDCL